MVFEGIMLSEVMHRKTKSVFSHMWNLKDKQKTTYRKQADGYKRWEVTK